MTQETRAETVRKAVRARREIVNGAIDTYLPMAEPERLYDASRYLLKAGGKRLRPTMLLLTAEAATDTPPLAAAYDGFPSCRPDEEPIDLLAAAVSVEVIQSFTLIHDDIMDEDDMRRGAPAVHVAFDEETAILAGDTLYSKAFEIMLETDAPADRSIGALDRLASTCTRICEGQALDVDFEQRVDVTTDEYLDMVDRKTAELFGAATSIPMILLGAEDDAVESLNDFGRTVGQAFQIQDDILDLTVPSEQLGKQRGSDLVEGKQTIITQHARAQGVDVDGLIDTDDPEAVTESTVEAAVEELEAAGSIEYARNLAQDLIAEGKDRLQVLPENEARFRLTQVADYLVERGY